MIANTALVCAVGGLCTCTVFLGLVIYAAMRFGLSNEETVPPGRGNFSLAPVTILKPVHGLEPLLEESLESFFRQDYPRFELIFGARSKDDPALRVAHALAKKYPQVPTKTVLSGEPSYPNAKVYLLEKMLPAASYPTLVIADSDVRVTSNYLEEVVRPLLDPGVGMVTCLYRGVPTGGVWSRLEALGMSVEMSSGVLVANLLEGMKFALGPTMATRKDVVDSMGGFGALADYLADDFVLGNLIADSGKTVALSHHVIDHVVLNRSARESFLHQVRWMKSSRFSRPLGHLGTVLTFAVPFGLLGFAVGWMRGDWKLGLGLLGLAIANCMLQALAVGWGIVRDPRSLTSCWLYPVRDLLGFFLWCASYYGKEIVWRGERYRLARGGRMVREPVPAQAAQTGNSVV
jgi:ceramide glucosyltransferase